MKFPLKKLKIKLKIVVIITRSAFKDKWMFKFMFYMLKFTFS